VGHLYTIHEGSEELSSTPFQPTRQFPDSKPIPVDNEPRLHTTWFLEPVPLPVPANSPGLLVINPKGSDLDIWRIFRRYLFDYRAEQTPPLTLLLDASGRARKIYSTVPSSAEVRADMSDLKPPTLPFDGKFCATTPSRDYFKLGAAFFWAGHPDQALPYLDEVVRRAPENERALMSIAQIHLDAGRVDDARAAVRRLLEAPPLSVVATDHLGFCFAEKGLYREARDLFQRAMRIQRNYAPVLNNLGVLYMKMGQPSDAIAAFRYGIREAPDDDMLYLNLGRVYIQQGDREKARGVILEWLDRKPGNENARRALREVDSR
jgi:tetratricopeptide (TPR) repeat protein